MSKKGGKKGGKTTMNLTEFTGDKNAGVASDTLAWAEDDWEDEQHQEEQAQAAKHGLFNRKAGAMDDFRSASFEQLSTVVPVDMVAPFVAHVGNLPNSISEAELEKAFEEFFPIVSVGVVKRPKSTFGYVEVTNREDLQALILQTGRNVGGRKIRCDVASEEQIQRFKGGGKQESMLSRDALGQEQPEFRMGGMGGGRGMRQSGSMGDFSRDNFGDEEQRGGGMGFGGGFGSVEDLGDFRSSGPVAQPAAPQLGGRDGNFRGGNFRGSKENLRSGGNSQPASPNVQQPPAPQDFSSWRDAPQVAQPNAPAVDKEEKPVAEKQGDKKIWGAKKKDPSPTSKGAPSDGGAWRRGEAQQSPAPAEKKQSPAPAEKKPQGGGFVKQGEALSAPKANPWGKKPVQPPVDNGSRFGALQK